MLSHIRTIDLFFFLKKLIALNWRGEGSYTMYSRFLARPEAPPSVILYVKETTILTRNPSRRFYFAIPHPKELTYRFQRGEYYTRSSSAYFYIKKMTFSFDVEKKKRMEPLKFPFNIVEFLCTFLRNPTSFLSQHNCRC